jgi:hypothetical protein
MSDQPGIPAIMVFPPFNPAPRQADPVPAPAHEQAPDALESPAEARGWDVEAPAAPVAWDFEAPAAGEPAALEADDGSDDDGAMGDEEDLPWLEVPAPAADEPDAELKADEAPNWMEWVRDEGQAAADEEATPIGDLQPEDAQPWSPETETAADDWATPAATDAWQAPADEAAADEPDPWQTLPPPDAASPDPWEAPSTSEVMAEPWQAPPAESPSAGGEAETAADFDLPEPELYDLPDATPAAAPWTEAEAPLFEAPAGEAMGAEAEPAWELPAPAADAPPAWESFAPPADAPSASADAESQAASGPFAAVADRLQAIADALRSDPGAFLAGAQGGGDPLGLLVAGFVLGFNARQGGRS